MAGNRELLAKLEVHRRASAPLAYRGPFVSCILILMLMCFSHSARSETGEAALWSGNTMLKHCKRSVETNDADAMVGICTGSIATLLNIRELLDADATFCPPKTVTADQATRVVVKFLEQAPELLHQDSRALAIVAFQRAWPCGPDHR